MTESIERFRARKLGMFIHWGLYCVPGGRHNGEVMDSIGEWFQSYFRMPNEEYAQFASVFNPVNFDAEEWITKAAAAGFKYIVLTTKHHDGFCMYDTKISDYNIVKMTPWHRDPLRELAEACRRHGLGVGVYYSQNLDWHEFDAQCPPVSRGLNCGKMHWGNDWDFPDQSQKDFGRFFHNKVMPQIRELLTNYGDICELWCDCPIDMEKQYSEELRKMVKELQPDCMINSRIGNGCEDFGGLGDNELLYGRSSRPLESPGTLNRTWGFKYDDHEWKSTRQIISQWLSLTEKNCNYLLNIGPRPDGTFTPETDAIFAEMAAWLKGKEDAIYASDPNPFPQEFEFAYCTAKENRLHFFLKGKFASATLTGIDNKLLSATVPFRQEGDKVVLDLSGVTEELFPLVTVTLDGAPRIRQILRPVEGKLQAFGALAEIHCGSDQGEIRHQVDVAGVVQAILPHASLSRALTIVNWCNPNDSLEWKLEFDQPGDYELSLVSQINAWGIWDEDCKIEITWQDQKIQCLLNPDKVEKTPHYTRRTSLLGTLHVASPIRGSLFLKPLAHNDKIPFCLQLLSIHCKLQK